LYSALLFTKLYNSFSRCIECYSAD